MFASELLHGDNLAGFNSENAGIRLAIQVNAGMDIVLANSAECAGFAFFWNWMCNMYGRIWHNAIIHPFLKWCYWSFRDDITLFTNEGLSLSYSSVVEPLAGFEPTNPHYESGVLPIKL